MKLGFKLSVQLFLFFTILLSSELSFAELKINLPEFYSIQRISNEIEAKCPIQSCVVIGLGRSPTPILAYFRTHGRVEAYQLPLTHFRFGEGTFQHLTKTPTLQLLRHFGYYIPLERIGNRNVLLVDYSESGFSLMSAYNYIQAYFRFKSLQNTIQALAIVQEEDVLRFKLKYPHIKVLTLAGDRAYLSFAFQNQSYDDYSPYGKFNISNDVPTPKTAHESEKFLELVKKLQEMALTFGNGPILLPKL